MNYKYLIAGGLLTASSLIAQPTFIAGWDFDGYSNAKSVNANWGSQINSAKVYFDGTGPSSNFFEADFEETFQSEFQSDSANAAPSNTFLVQDTLTGFNAFSANFPASLANLQFVGISGSLDSGKRAIIQFSGANFTGLSLQLAAFNTGSGTVDYTFSTNGTTFSALESAVSYGSAFELDTINLSALDGATTAYIGIEFNNSANDQFAFDNLQITGVAAIPEPSSYAVIAGIFGLGLAVYRRRAIKK